MRILISTFGTRGDIQPFIALGKGLQAAGHAVRICTSEGFRPWVERHSLGYGWLSNDLLDLTRSTLRGAEKNPVRLMQRMLPAMRRMLAEEWAALYFGGNFSLSALFLVEHGYLTVALSRSRYNRCLYAIKELFLTLFSWLGEHWKALNDASIYLIDSFPLPSCDNARIRCSRR